MYVVGKVKARKIEAIRKRPKCPEEGVIFKVKK
jgi:hypothetical protein